MTREPTDDRKRRDGAWIVGFVLLILAVYTGSYFVTSTRRRSPSSGRVLVYGAESMARVYIPAAWIEAKLVKHRVVLAVRDPTGEVYAFPFLVMHP